MNVNDLVSRAAKYDEGLARDIQKFVENRQFGLVYEESKPEFVRLYKKPIVVGDTVNILPPRGEVENLSSDTDEHETKWRVVYITDQTAHLVSLDSDDETDVSVDDIVPFVRFDQPIYAGLKEVDRVERGGDKPYQVVINGENFHALESLVFAYQGKVDCIYIDPPYNSGATDWKYNNNYVNKDDVYKHSKWLTFMEDRLKLAKKLLNPQDSVLICTIDEKEYLRLGLLLEQLFPEARIQMVTSMINKKAATRSQEFSRAGEYLFFLMFGKCTPGNARLNMMTGDLNEDKKPISYEGLRRRGGKRSESPGCFYPVFINEKDGTMHSVGEPIALGIDRHSVVPPEGTWAAWPINADDSESRWQINRDRFISQWADSTLVLSSFEKERESATVLYLKNADLQKIQDGTVVITGKDTNGQLLAELADENTANNSPKSIWVMNSHDASVYGTTLHKKFVPNSDFAFPKSLYAVEDCLRFFVEDKPDALIVDFFAGSGTTAHATMRLNHQDGGRRRSICITNNEINAKEIKRFSKAGMRQGDIDWEKRGIFMSITMPRLKAAITGTLPDGTKIEGTYGIPREVYSIDEDAQAISKKTGKPINKIYYLKKKVQDSAVPDAFSISDGFEENVVFYDLDYLEPTVVQADMAFNEIAPLLWLKAGSKGRVIQHCEKYDITDNYAVLFDYRYIGAFTREVQKKPDVKTIFIVTDHDARYRDMCATFPDRNVTQLYESYLRSFEISSEV